MPHALAMGGGRYRRRLAAAAPHHHPACRTHEQAHGTADMRVGHTGAAMTTLSKRGAAGGAGSGGGGGAGRTLGPGDPGAGEAACGRAVIVAGGVSSVR